MVVSEELKRKYQPTIGMECHVQLNTRTKLFAAVSNDARQAEPNTLISHICVGLPGALPVLNRAAIELSVKAALALGTQPQKFSRFERKHYFYPDLPKGYQITQYEESIIKGGKVELKLGEQVKAISIERANLEEDAGKNIHPAAADYSLVDLNRAGTPLLEIVSAPEIASAAEAKAFARELWLLMKYAGVTDGDLYHGHVRFDVNVSVSRESGKKGKRSEIKNLNSFRSVESAVTYEIERQIEVLEKGGNVLQETRGWDEAKQKSYRLRIKEEAQDYRYMPEPDVPPLELSDDFINGAKDQIPRLPNDWRQILNKLSIPHQSIETLIDIEADDKEAGYLDLIQSNSDDQVAAQLIASWIVNIIAPNKRKGLLTNKDIKHHLILLPYMVRIFVEGEVSSTSVKNMLVEILIEHRESEPPKSYEEVMEFARRKGYLQVSDEGQIEKIVDEVIKANPNVVEDIKGGQEKAIGFLVGQVMQKSGGQANPSLAHKIIRQKLGL